MGLVQQVELQMSLVTLKKMRMGLGAKRILPRLIRMILPVLLMASAMASRVPVPVLLSRRLLQRKAAVSHSTRPSPYRSR